MNIFDLHNAVLDRYRDYVKGFLSIADPAIQSFVEEKLIEQRKLWPDALLQLNPSYAKADTVSELVSRGILHPTCAGIFQRRDKPIHLYRHQQEAIAYGLQRQSFVVTSGTGSGKSLTYFIPIFDAILREGSAAPKVTAIVVYPMNALVNSQHESLLTFAESYKRRTGQEMPVRFAKYTGQESDSYKRQYQENPPHIILTNYVMLELILIRPGEQNFVDRAQSGLQFLVLDELHTYRGRQGADVAMLARRLRQRCGNSHLTCIGTSATMATGTSPEERRQAVSDFASKLFGETIPASHVVEETLCRTIPENVPTDPDTLRNALQGLFPSTVGVIFPCILSAPGLRTLLGCRSNPMAAFLGLLPSP